MLDEDGFPSEERVAKCREWYLPQKAYVDSIAEMEPEELRRALLKAAGDLRDLTLEFDGFDREMFEPYRYEWDVKKRLWLFLALTKAFEQSLDDIRPDHHSVVRGMRIEIDEFKQLFHPNPDHISFNLSMLALEAEGRVVEKRAIPGRVHVILGPPRPSADDEDPDDEAA